MKSKRPVRRSQLISPFGVGAIVNFPNNESWMTLGLDEWPKAFEECPSEWKIEEERLQKRLGTTHFRLPPDFRERSDDSKSDLSFQKIPYLRFPRWHYCPKCFTMKFLPSYGQRVRCNGSRFGSVICNDTPEKSRPMLIPSRFIAICSKGHIEDFPFMQWVHGDKEWNHEQHQLTINPGKSSSSLAGTYIKCSCGEGRSMANSFNDNALSSIGYYCSGLQPWLGKVTGVPGECADDKFRVVQRGSSNVYFPDVKSSIYIPVSGEEKNSRKINKLLNDPKIWAKLRDHPLDGKINRVISDTISDMRELDPDELYSAAQKKLEATIPVQTSQEDDLSNETIYRYSEFKAITEGVGGETTDLFTESINIENYEEPWSSYFSEIVLVKKLRETRVLSGFSRLLPPSDNNDIVVQKLAKDEEIKWLPAVTVNGEGIFLKFNEQKIKEWSEQENVIERIDNYNQKHNKFRKERNMEPVEHSAKFLLIHTLSHILINQLSYESGYGSSSIRERIYCDMEEMDKKMGAILIYTASGDSEGTLGGLVRQGEEDRLPEILSNTLNKAKWCTNDPICIESNGQGINNSNLAACHSCALIAETSCEHGNRYLDRALLIGTIEDESLGFFTK